MRLSGDPAGPGQPAPATARLDQARRKAAKRRTPKPDLAAAEAAAEEAAEAAEEEGVAEAGAPRQAAQPSLAGTFSVAGRDLLPTSSLAAAVGASPLLHSAVRLEMQDAPPASPPAQPAGGTLRPAGGVRRKGVHRPCRTVGCSGLAAPANHGRCTDCRRNKVVMVNLA